MVSRIEQRDDLLLSTLQCAQFLCSETGDDASRRYSWGEDREPGWRRFTYLSTDDVLRCRPIQRVSRCAVRVGDLRRTERRPYSEEQIGFANLRRVGRSEGTPQRAPL
jgi:hypothetical protein